MGLLAHHRRYWSLAALAVLALPMLFEAVTPRQTVSVSEARNLAPPPSWPVTRAEITAWPRAAEEFLDDHFGLRDALVRTNGLLRYAVVSPSDLLVLYGRDRFLYFDGDAMMAQSMGLIRRQAAIDKFADFAAALHRKLAARGARFLVAIPPNSATVIRYGLPGWAREGQRPTEYDLMPMALAARGVPALDLRPPLSAGSRGSPLYRRTDTHWNRLGALTAYNAVVRALGTPEWAIDPERAFKGYEDAPGGDLAHILGVSADVTDRDARIDLSSYDPPQAKVTPIDTRHETGGDLVETGRLGPTVMVLGDSFTRYFWQDYFALHAGRYVWIHDELCGFVPEIADSFAPDIVVLAPTERFMFCWKI